MFTTTASAFAFAINTVDTVAVVAERSARVSGTILWVAGFLAVAVTGACVNATAPAREAYALAAVEQAQFMEELQAERLMLPAGPVAAVPSVEAFIGQVLQSNTVADLGAEMDGDVISARITAAVGPVVDMDELASDAVSIAGESFAQTLAETDAALGAMDVTRLNTLTVRELKAEAKALGLKGYSKLAKSDLVQFIAQA